MASTVGAGVSEAAPVRAERLSVGQSLPPDAPSSCRGGPNPVGGDTSIAMTHRYLPSMLTVGYKTEQPHQLPGASRGRFTPVLATKRG